MQRSLCSLSIFRGRNNSSCTDANVFNMWGIPETDRQWSSQRLPLPCLLIALVSGGCHGGERSPPCRSLKDDLLLPTETSGTQPGQVLIAQILQCTFRSFRPKQAPPSLCQMEEHYIEKTIDSFSASWEHCISPLSASLFSVQYWSHAAHFNFAEMLESDRCVYLT